MLLGHTTGIETDYKKAMHAKREIPASSCPSYIENMIYASCGMTDKIEQDEQAGFQIMLDELDEKSERFENRRTKKEYVESRFHKYRRLGIRNGTWCSVDTDGVFEYCGRKYRIDPSAEQYQPKQTEQGDLYDMDRVLAVDGEQFYDMAFNEVSVKAL